LNDLTLIKSNCEQDLCEELKIEFEHDNYGTNEEAIVTEVNEEENSEMIDCQDERQLNNEDNGEKVTKYNL